MNHAARAATRSPPTSGCLIVSASRSTSSDSPRSRLASDAESCLAAESTTQQSRPAGVHSSIHSMISARTRLRYLQAPNLLGAPGRIRTCAPASGGRYNAVLADVGWCRQVLVIPVITGLQTLWSCWLSRAVRGSRWNSCGLFADRRRSTLLRPSAQVLARCP